MKATKLMLAAMLSGAMFACSNSNEVSENNNAEEIAVEAVEPVNDSFSEAELANARKQFAPLMEHMKIVGNAYVLDITEEEAAKLGVDKEYYNYAKEDIARANEAIAKAIAAGDTVDMMDFKKLIGATEAE